MIETFFCQCAKKQVFLVICEIFSANCVSSVKVYFLLSLLPKSLFSSTFPECLCVVPSDVVKMHRLAFFLIFVFLFAFFNKFFNRPSPSRHKKKQQKGSLSTSDMYFVFKLYQLSWTLVKKKYCCALPFCCFGFVRIITVQVAPDMKSSWQCWDYRPFWNEIKKFTCIMFSNLLSH